MHFTWSYFTLFFDITKEIIIIFASSGGIGSLAFRMSENNLTESCVVIDLCQSSNAILASLSGE